MNGGEWSSVEALTVARKIRKEYAKSTHAPPRPDQGDLDSLERASLKAWLLPWAQIKMRDYESRGDRFNATDDRARPAS